MCVRVCVPSSPSSVCTEVVLGCPRVNDLGSLGDLSVIYDGRKVVVPPSSVVAVLLK